jgi:hypothetical protein
MEFSTNNLVLSIYNKPSKVLFALTKLLMTEELTVAIVGRGCAGGG